MADRHNLCRNPALGVDVTGWGGSSTPARTAVTGFDRSWAARYTAGTFISTAATGAVTVGQTYTVSVSLRTASFGVSSGAIYIEWINAGGGGFGYPSANYSASAATVTRVSVTAVAPAGAVAARVIVDGINYSVNTADFTTVLIEQAVSLQDYFDGDSPGASWDGTPGLSSSTLPDAAPVSGTVGVTLPALTAGLTGAVQVAGQAAATLPPLSAALTGALTVTGAAAGSLPALTGALAGQVITPAGALAAALPALTASLTGTSNAADPPPARLTSGSGPAAAMTGGSHPLVTLRGGEG